MLGNHWFLQLSHCIQDVKINDVGPSLGTIGNTLHNGSEASVMVYAVNDGWYGLAMDGSG